VKSQEQMRGSRQWGEVPSQAYVTFTRRERSRSLNPVEGEGRRGEGEGMGMKEKDGVSWLDLYHFEGASLFSLGKCKSSWVNLTFLGRQ
jgi:hypothetical protein